MTLAIIGSRDFNDKKMAENVFLFHFYNSFKKDALCIVSGDCLTGGDAIGKALALKYQLKYSGFPAKWDDLTLIPCSIGINKAGKKYNKLAGFNRNKDIIENCDTVLAFWDGKSRGTYDSLKIAKELKKPTFIVYF